MEDGTSQEEEKAKEGGEPGRAALIYELLGDG